MHRKSKNLFVSSGLALMLSTMGTSYSTEISNQSMSDIRREVQIWTTYALNPYLRGESLKATVKDGTAILSGNVHEGISKELAKEIALGVEGIKDVDNQIKVVSEVAVSNVKPKNNFADAIDDATITAAVKSKLMWSKYTDGLKTTVVTKSGRVSLTGSADGAAAKDLAGRLAANTKGVVSVNNALIVFQENNSDKNIVAVAASDAERTVSDSWITTKVKSTLLFSSNVSGSEVEVTTRSGVVSLSGNLENGAEIALAIELAKNIRGVKRVDTKELTLSSGTVLTR